MGWEKGILFFKSKRKFIFKIIISLIIALGVGYVAIKPPSTKSVYETVKDYNSSDIVAYLDKVYPSNGGFLGVFKDTNTKSKLEVLRLVLNDKTDNLTSTSSSTTSSNAQSIKIEKTDIEYPKYKGDYVNVNITIINNGSKPINYVKINLYGRDNSDKIVQSDWTNDSSVIQVGAKQTITKMFKKGTWTYVTSEIVEAR